MAMFVFLTMGYTTVGLAQAETETAPVSDTTQTMSTKVKGVTCSTDLKMISANVEKLEGVSTCKAVKTGPTTTFEIAYDPQQVTGKEIHAAIQNTGSCENPDERPYKVKR